MMLNLRKSIPSQSGKSIVSITNSAGVYFLEGLTQNTYHLKLNGQSVDVPPVEIAPDSESLQEINLQLLQSSLVE